MDIINRPSYFDAFLNTAGELSPLCLHHFNLTYRRDFAREVSAATVDDRIRSLWNILKTLPVPEGLVRPEAFNEADVSIPALRTWYDRCEKRYGDVPRTMTKNHSILLCIANFLSSKDVTSLTVATRNPFPVESRIAVLYEQLPKTGLETIDPRRVMQSEAALCRALGCTDCPWPVLREKYRQQARAIMVSILAELHEQKHYAFPAALSLIKDAIDRSAAINDDSSLDEIEEWRKKIPSAIANLITRLSFDTRIPLLFSNIFCHGIAPTWLFFNKGHALDLTQALPSTCKVSIKIHNDPKRITLNVPKRITHLNVKECSALQQVNVADGSAIFISDCPTVTQVDVKGRPQSEASIWRCPALRTLATSDVDRLYIEKCKQLNAVTFNNIVRLFITNCKNLSSLTIPPTTREVLHSTVKIKGCPKLVNLIVEPKMSITCTDCPELKTVVAPIARSIVLRGCPSLEELVTPRIEQCLRLFGANPASDAEKASLSTDRIETDYSGAIVPNLKHLTISEFPPGYYVYLLGFTDQLTVYVPASMPASKRRDVTRHSPRIQLVLS